MLVDSHCHLDRLNLNTYEGDLAQAIAAAREVGVEQILCVAIDLATIPNVLVIAEQNPGVHASVGVHPLEQEDQGLQVEQLISLAKHPKVVAIGETGLDYYYGKDYIALQKRNFLTHIQAARSCKKPLIIHSRDAKEDTLKCISEQADLSVGGVMHCFTEDWDMAQRALDMNFYISLSGIVTFKNAVQLQEVAKKIPLDKLLIETDAPYLAPVPFRGKPNEPKYLVQVAEYIAKLRGISMAEIAAATTLNYQRLFNIA
ncbi:MAG: TatD family hydrolase [Pseudomonadales bacterium]|nr:TatD family hydrolase [Pseudomonadales bacterium]